MSFGTVAERMSKFVHSLEPDHSVAAGHRLMDRLGVRHLAVLKDGNVQGVVTRRDLYLVQAFRTSDAEDIAVSEAMERTYVVAAPTDGTVHVCAEMAEAKADYALVMDGEKLKGIFTAHDALLVVSQAEQR